MNEKWYVLYMQYNSGRGGKDDEWVFNIKQNKAWRSLKIDFSVNIKEQNEFK